MRKNIFKKLGICMLTAVMTIGLVACNTDIKVTYDYDASQYIKLGQYKGLEVDINTEAIAEELIEKRILNDLAANVTYSEVSRAAQEKDQVTLTYSASVGGQYEVAFSNEDDVYILGTDTFVIDGFLEEVYGMKAGETKVVILQVPEDFEDDYYAGSRIVFDITLEKVEQPITPMITDAYAQEYLSFNTVAEYRASIEAELQDFIDETIYEKKKELVFEKLEENIEVLGYPEEFVEKKKAEFEQSMGYYSLMLGMSNDEYCQHQFGISFDEYVKNAVVIDAAMQLIIKQEEMVITEYEYKGNLEAFANEMGYSSKKTFTEKFDKQLIVQNMLIVEAQKFIIDNAVYNYITE